MMKIQNTERSNASFSKKERKKERSNAMVLKLDLLAFVSHDHVTYTYS